MNLRSKCCGAVPLTEQNAFAALISFICDLAIKNLVNAVSLQKHLSPNVGCFSRANELFLTSALAPDEAVFVHNEP